MCFVLGCAAAATPNTYCTHARKEGVNWRIGYTNENPLRSNTERKTHKQHLRLIIHNLPLHELVLWKTRENVMRLRITILMHLENTACLKEEADDNNNKIHFDSNWKSLIDYSRSRSFATHLIVHASRRKVVGSWSPQFDDFLGHLVHKINPNTNGEEHVGGVWKLRMLLAGEWMDEEQEASHDLLMGILTWQQFRFCASEEYMYGK